MQREGDGMCDLGGVRGWWRPVVVLAPVAVLLLLSGGASAGAVEDCGSSDPAVREAGCTQIIAAIFR